MGRQLSGGRVGRPGKRDTTLCPLTTEQDRERATEWVRTAIRNRQCLFQNSDKEFPKKIWHEADGQIWMGVCFNGGSGEYKGWPICEKERDDVFGKLGR